LLILIGEDADNIESQLAGTVDISRASTLDEAVGIGFGAAQKGDSVLLAPACASFDMFESFEERGNVFKEAVLKLQERITSSAEAAATPPR
jgi:UDP-N-acetylmuramoylalanine--D-glutamate ligase